MTESFEPRRGLPIVEAVVHGPAGAAVARLLLDTGATFTMLKPLFLRARGYDLAATRASVRIAGVSRTELVPIYVLSRISALGVERSNIAVLSHSLPSVVPLDGLLGLNFLRGHRLMIDFRDGVITLE